jgi:hypothetical protein
MRQLGRWLFELGDARTAAALRIGLCGWYLLVLWDFHPAMPLLFGHAGLFGTLEPFPYKLSGFQYLLYIHNSDIDLNIWFWSSVLVAALGLFGLFSRLSVLLTFLSMILFRERGPFITFGADLVMNCIGFWVLFLNCGRVWSIDSLLRSPAASDGGRPIEFWPVKAIQIQVAMVYLVTGIAKLPTQPWQDGSAVYYAIQVGSVFKGHPPSWIVSHHHALLLMTYATLAIEISIPFLLFYRPTRFWAILAGFAMHSGIDLFMSIRFFSLAMYVGYLSYIDRSDWNRLQSLAIQVRGLLFSPGRGSTMGR